MARYLMLIYAPTDPTVKDEAGTDVQRWREFGELLERAGVRVHDARLGGPETAVAVHRRGGDLVRTDGPFADTKEYLAGFYELEATDIETLVELAGAVPSIHYATVELRPVIDLS